VSDQRLTKGSTKLELAGLLFVLHRLRLRVRILLLSITAKFDALVCLVVVPLSVLSLSLFQPFLMIVSLRHVGSCSMMGAPLEGSSSSGIFCGFPNLGIMPLVPWILIFLCRGNLGCFFPFLRRFTFTSTSLVQFVLEAFGLSD
jgi:hypothetical protein